MPIGSSTVTLTSGSAVVTGAATLFQTTLRQGDMFFCGGFSSPIASITNNTSLTLDLVVPASEAGAGKVWSYAPNQNATLARQVSDDVTGWRSYWQNLMSGPLGSLASVSAYSVSLLGNTSALAWRTAIGAMAAVQASMTLKAAAVGDNIALFFTDAGNTNRMTFFANGAGDLRMLNNTSGKEMRLLATGEAGFGVKDFIIKADGKIGIGTDAPKTPFEIVNKANGDLADLTCTNYGTAFSGIFHGRQARGTEASPLPALRGDGLGGFGGKAYDGTNWQGSSSGSIHMVAMENITPANYGAGIAFLTTPIGSTTRRRAVWITPSGMLWAVNNAAGFEAYDTTQTDFIGGCLIQASASSAVAVGATINAVGYGLATPGFRGIQARGSNIAPSASQTNDLISFLAGHGHDGTSFPQSSAALVGMRAGGVWSATSRPTYITFETTPIGTTARAERVRIADNGFVGIGTSTPAAALDVVGSVLLSQTIGFSSQFPVLYCGFAGGGQMFYRPGGVGVTTNEIRHTTSILTVGGFGIHHDGRANITLAATVATLPSASGLGGGANIYVTNESGGAVLAFSDGANWRRVTDRAIVS